MKIVLYVFLVCCASCTFGCNNRPSCGETVLQTAESPSADRAGNKIKAEVVQVNCGATTDFITEVRLAIGSGSQQTETAVFANDHGTPHLSLKWVNGENLIVDCPDCLQDNTTLLTTKKNFTVIRYPFTDKER